MAMITVYYKEDFNGKHVDLPLQARNYDKAELERLGIENNSISSVKVPPGWKVIFFKNPGFAGESMEVLANAEDLGTLNNNVSSLKVMQDPATTNRAAFFYKKNFDGKEVDLPRGEYHQDALERYGIDNNTISSLRVPPGLKVILYKHDGFSGPSETVTGAGQRADLGSLDNNVSSLKIMPA